MTKCIVTRPNGYSYEGVIIGTEVDNYLDTVEVIVKRDDTDEIMIEQPEDVVIAEQN